MARPVLLVHGLWLHADSWGSWVEKFAGAGYEAAAPGWPGDSPTVEEARANPERAAGVGVAAVVDHYAGIIRGLSEPPVVVGHSFGGLIAQRLLADGHAAAAVAIDPAPIKGIMYLPPSALRVASVALKNPANLKRAVSLSQKQFRYGFGNALPEAESNELFERWTIPSPGKPLFEAAAANFAPGSPVKVDLKNPARGPLLLVSGGKDHTVPPSVVHATARLQRKSGGVADLREFADRGHSLTIDHGWEEIADAALAWLAERQL